MSRLTSVARVEISQQVIKRDNNRLVCFGSDKDMAAYISWLIEYANKYQVAIHAWLLITDRVHLLATPYSESDISKMLQFLGRRYMGCFIKVVYK